MTNKKIYEIILSRFPNFVDLFNLLELMKMRSKFIKNETKINTPFISQMIVYTGIAKYIIPRMMEVKFEIMAA